MTLQTLTLEGFRNLHSAEIHWHPETNLILGANAAGKTSLLEAIHFLARFQSFRTHRLERLVQHEKPLLRLVARLEDSAGNRHVLGMELGDGRRRIRLDGRDLQRRSMLLELLPLQLLNQDAHLLIEAGPEHRRRFLDWGVFHVEPAYREALSRYHRLLRQRNAALRKGSSAREIRVWDAELAESAAVIDRHRREYVASLQSTVSALLPRLVRLGSLSLEYRRGWPADQSLEEQLATRLPGDRERGYTFAGPHRADLGIQVEGRAARDRLSRGQQKLLVSALMLAQLRMLCDRSHRTALVLVDDLPSELDVRHRERLFELLLELPVQRFVTAIEPGQLPELRNAGTLFHVEHGTVRKMVYC